ncbi:MAG: hypothetical protein P3W87_000355 [Gammaproteobacteria bacterium]|nr:hypothetical protein [Gammaproteobacteria bacterium]
MTAKKLLDGPLAYCNTFSQQKAWCEGRLLSNETLTYPQIFLGGADPERILRALRKEGLPIKTVYVETVDAAGHVHPKTLAWRIA